MRVALLVQHHPGRGPIAHRLLQTFAPAEAIIVPDPRPDSPIKSAWRTYKRCLETLVELDVDAGVILQDDTLAVPGFERAAAAAFEARPGRLISFYHSTTPAGNMRGLQVALQTCEPFFELRSGTWVPTVALGWPVDRARDFLAWVEEKKPNLRADWVTDDPIVGEFALPNRGGIGCLATAPSLVEHPDDVVTIVGSARGGGKRYEFRQAYCWIGDVPVDEWIALL